MAQFVINTTDQYTKCVVDYTTSITGQWPRLLIVVNYKMFIRLTSAGSWYINGCTFDFGGKKHTFNLNISAPTYAGTESAYLVSGSANFSTSGNGPTFNISPTVKVSTSLWSGQAEIPTGFTMYGPESYGISTIDEIESSSAVVHYWFNDNYKYWRLRIRAGSRIFTPPVDYQTSSYEMTGLSPDTSYSVNMEIIDRSGTTRYTTGAKTFRTLVDQLRVWVKHNGTLKKALVWVKQGGQVKKVLKAYVKQGGSIKPVKGA